MKSFFKILLILIISKITENIVCGNQEKRIDPYIEIVKKLNNKFHDCIDPVRREIARSHINNTRYEFNIQLNCGPEFKNCSNDYKNEFDNVELTESNLNILKQLYLSAVGRIVAPHPLCDMFYNKFNDKNEDSLKCFSDAESVLYTCPIDLTDSEYDLRDLSEKKLKLYNDEDCKHIKGFTECIFSKYEEHCPDNDFDSFKTKFTQNMLSASKCLL